MSPPKIKYIIGIDEAGRGPIAGPVAIGLVLVKYRSSTSILKGIKDSKQLSEHEREVWEDKIKENFMCTSVLVGNQTIDEKGISRGISIGIRRGLKRLGKKPEECYVILDGRLQAPAKYTSQETIIKGDEKEPLIAAASILAKTRRDKYMKNVAKKYPEYGFEVHKGYGTKAHYKALKKQGLCPLHRVSWLTEK